MSGEPVPPESLVADTETLYRAVRNDPRFIAIDSDGNARISSMAFNDPSSLSERRYLSLSLNMPHL